MQNMNDSTHNELNLFSTMTPRQQGRILFAQGLSVAEISRHLNENQSTVQSWKQRDGWEKADIFDDVTLGLRARFLSLIFADNKSNANYKEMDFLMRMLEKSAKIERYRNGGNESDLNENLKKRNAGERKKPLKNQFTQEEIDKLTQAFEELFFDFQHEWGDAVEQARIFMMLKSRQIGATFYFALWALINLFKTGKNKIFLSASKAQAYQFVEYIKAFVMEHTNKELKGNPIEINMPEGRQANIYYLGTNALTSQGKHGDVIMDEFFWIRNFTMFRKVASAMVSQKMYKQIYISTPSSILHQAYEFWAGTDGKRKKQTEIDISKATLKIATKGADRRTRQIVTLTDAEKRGYDRFSREDLEAEYSEDEFANLFECEFIDDSGSYFPLDIIEPNMIDTWETWTDYHPFDSEPYAGEVWLGYDPSFTGDKAALVVVAPPVSDLSPYRILHVQQLIRLQASEQALIIKKFIERYNVTFIGLDNTGNGLAVGEYVKKFYPSVKLLNYNADLKVKMGLRTKELFKRRRLNFDTSKVDIAKSFMSIRKALTSKQGAQTLVTTRSAETGHGDMAWAIMNALECAPIIDIVDEQISNAMKPRIRIFKG